MQRSPRTRFALALIALLLSGAGASPGAGAPKEGRSVLDFRMKRIDGQEQDLSQYAGKVVLIVNVASKCGLTPQYDGLEKLYESRKDRGFVVLGFPANEFAGQEPGSDAQIADFCRSSYGVKFPMFSKIVVKGEGIHPLYQRLTSLPPPIGGEVKWNFQKYLVDRRGQVVAKFEPKVTPEDPALVARIDALLDEQPGAPGRKGGA
jgi:glutathione peroxidase